MSEINVDFDKLGARLGTSDPYTIPKNSMLCSLLARVLTDSTPSANKKPHDNWENALYWAQRIYTLGRNDGLRFAIDHVEREFLGKANQMTEKLKYGIK